jgi:hypothetical protein
VNRVADSLEIWNQVVTSPLLYQVSLILFLNSESCSEGIYYPGLHPCSCTYLAPSRWTRLWSSLEIDLLCHKLKSGIQIKTFIPEYEGRNEYEGEDRGR